MSLLSRLFGGGGSAAKPKAEPVMHNGFSIFAEPMKDGGSWRLCARIEKEIDGELMSHQMIRADTFTAQDQAETESVNKAMLFIDQMGEKIFR